MSDCAEHAVKLREEKGYNCAQAVACAYAEKLGVDPETVFKAAEGFGVGLGCTQGVCGALSAACLLAGLANSSGNPELNSKIHTQATSAQLVREFKQEVGALICRDIKGIESGKLLKSCPDCVRAASQAIEKVLLSHEELF